MRIVCGIISPASTLGESGRTRCRSLERYLYPAVSRPGTQQNGTGSTVTCTSGSPPPPSRHSGCYIHFPRGFPIRLAGWEPFFIDSAAGGVNPPGGRVRLRRTPGRRAAPMPLWGMQGPRRGNYLYFRLSATAISSQRLLNSFSAWFSHPACRMGALFH